MRFHRHSRGPSKAELTAYADGSLPAKQRAQVTEALASSPELRAEVEAQRRVLDALDRAAGERAPSRLRARLVLSQPPDREPLRRPLRGFVPVGALAGAAAVLALVLTGGATAPTVVEASLLASRLPQTPIGEPAHDTGKLPGVHADGLTYPYWEDQFDFKASGLRRDQVGGRDATVVYYSRGANRVAYEIVSGSPLPLGAVSQSVVRQGVKYRALRTSHGTVVTWTRAGHTCVLTGTGTPVNVMLHLAAWRQGGRVPY